MHGSRKQGIGKLLLILIVLAISLPGAVKSLQGIKLGLDLAGGVSITYRTREDHPSEEDLQDVIYKLQKRVEAYSTEAEVFREGTNRINVDIPGVKDTKHILEELGAPGTLQFIDQEGNILLTGDRILEARAGYWKNATVQSNEYVVELSLDEEGRALFAQATKDNIGKTIHIVYDGETVSSPVVDQTITGGSCYIENLDGIEEAEHLAATIRIGSLPLELEEVRSTVIGAKLGEEAIETGLKAGIVGVLFVVVLMCIVFRIPGVAASVALLVYVAWMIFAIKGFDVTLTLPGIAGIILGIGMAVDANVIIFARIREEIASGISVQHAVRNGFSKAKTAIIDGNVTTLIAAIILLWMGVGIVKGFAQTLALGIVISMFTALIVTKIVLIALYEVGFRDLIYFGREKQYHYIDFVGKWRYFMLSGAVLVIGIAGMFLYGLQTKQEVWRFGLEFRGGTATTILMEEELSLEQITGEILPVVRSSIGGGQVEAQKVADTKEVILKTRTLTQDESETLSDLLQEQFQIGADRIRSDSISATISAEMRHNAYVSIFLSLISMMLYIWFRFKDMYFGVSALFALLHDVLAVVAVYILFRLVVGNAFVTCVLAIVGYSVNATIVVFDRIRERLQKSRGREGLQELVNQSITETLGRSVYTSLTTWIMAVSLYVFGVAGIREFALPLMIGILCGTYSSICLAGTTWCRLRIKYNKKSEI